MRSGGGGGGGVGGWHRARQRVSLGVWSSDSIVNKEINKEVNKEQGI